MPIRPIGKAVVRHIAPADNGKCSYQVEEFNNARLSVWRTNRYKRPELCQHSATYLIDGKGYCRRHAAMLALDKWVNGELKEVKEQKK